MISAHAVVSSHIVVVVNFYKPYRNMWTMSTQYFFKTDVFARSLIQCGYLILKWFSTTTTTSVLWHVWKESTRLHAVEEVRQSVQRLCDNPARSCLTMAVWWMPPVEASSFLLPSLSSSRVSFSFNRSSYNMYRGDLLRSEMLCLAKFRNIKVRLLFSTHTPFHMR